MHHLRSKLDWLVQKTAQNAEFLHQRCGFSLNNVISLLCSLSSNELNLLLITISGWSVMRPSPAVITEMRYLEMQHLDRLERPEVHKATEKLSCSPAA